MKKLFNDFLKKIEIDPNCPHGSQHFSGIFKNGKIVCTGNNHLRNSYNGRCVCFSTHAEIDVIHKVLNLLNPKNLKNYVMVVVRIGRDGNIKNSRPCNQCIETMCKYRIKKVIYSTDDESFEVQKPEYMDHLHISSGWYAYTSGRLFQN
jgi:tRNA(Arg) A34 adenosine deaminase TadA